MNKVWKELDDIYVGKGEILLQLTEEYEYEGEPHFLAITTDGCIMNIPIPDLDELFEEVTDSYTIEESAISILTKAYNKIDEHDEYIVDEGCTLLREHASYYQRHQKVDFKSHVDYLKGDEKIRVMIEVVDYGYSSCTVDW